MTDKPARTTARENTENTVVLMAGARLTAAQTARLVEAVAILRAKQAAVRAGLSAEDIGALEWVTEPSVSGGSGDHFEMCARTVDVDATDTEAAERVAPVLNGQSRVA